MGFTPLVWAASDGRVEIVQLLLAAGADKDKADNNDNTHLIVAASEDREMVQLLLSAGVEKNNITWRDRLATEGGHQDIVLVAQQPVGFHMSLTSTLRVLL